MSQVTALALFSGGLDSIVACRLVAAQGIRVVAVKFVTPFFDYALLADTDAYREEVRRRYGIEVVLEDLSEGYLELLHHPRHGFGKHFNPCIDCKILMLRRARTMMADFGASFLVTGEVLGQRPMSQRRDTLHVIERDSGAKGLLLRPLSARLLPETEAEARGWVDRDRLLNLGGRGRARQIALAREFGITDFPAPAGGCILADPILSRRIARIYRGDFVFAAEAITVTDVRLLLMGRQFRLPTGAWLILGRNEQENNRLQALAQTDDALLSMPVRPGPTALLRKAAMISSSLEQAEPLPEAFQLAAALVVRYGRKVEGGPSPAEVQVSLHGQTRTLGVAPLEDAVFQDWIIEDGRD